jgi:hypothetical protein
MMKSVRRRLLFQIERSGFVYKNADLFAASRQVIRMIFFPILALHTIGDLRAQNPVSDPLEIQAALSRHGFENVAVLADDAELLVTYENRIYRYDVRALREVFKIISKHIGPPSESGPNPPESRHPDRGREG